MTFPREGKFTSSHFLPRKILWVVGAEIWEGDECRRFQFLESGNSLNGRNLFNELSFL